MAQYREKLQSANVYYNIPSNTTHFVQKTPTIHKYGESLNASEPDKDMLYELFDTYFNHPTMTKIKDVDRYSVYMCKTYCLLSNECRYIVCFVNIDSFPKNTQVKLKDMRWVSIQTRTLTDNHKIPPHNYQPRRFEPLNVAIERVKTEEEASTYTCQSLPLIITLLHGKNGSTEYQAKGNVVSAIETYNTIITLIS